MPPKGQKMGSITHNSAEVTKNKSRAGMMSKLKQSFSTSSRTTATGKPELKQPRSNLGQSVASQQSRVGQSVASQSRLGQSVASQSRVANDARSRPRRATSNSHAVTSVQASEIKEELKSSFTVPRPPTSIMALVDAASCMTDDMTQQDTLLHAYQQPEPIEAGPPIRGSLITYGTQGTANRALTNLHPQDGMGGGSHSNSHDAYNDTEPVGYHDASGGGLFDESYMSSNRINSVSGHQPPPPDRRYNHNRRQSSAEEYRLRRTSNAEDYKVSEHGYYRGSSMGTYDSAPHEYSNGRYGPSEGDAYRNPPIQKRSSIDNAACGNYRRPSVERRPELERRHRSMGHGSSVSSQERSFSSQNSHGSAYNGVVNNTGRPSSIDSGSRTRSPKPTSQSNSSRMTVPSSLAKNNPSWLIENSDTQGNSLSRHFNDDDDRTMATMATKQGALGKRALNKARDMTSPAGEVTIVYTDVQGSTSMWESCPSDMKKATDIHDTILRQCYTNHSGYEISTEGDSFNLAFQHPVDALAFALQAQIKLFKADWPDGILKLSDGKDEPALKFRGFRVRFGIHHGPTNTCVHEMTGRMIYSGEGVKIAKSVEGMCHGGQILTTMETWKAVSGMAERYLGRPQILDCGEHLLYESKNQNSSNGYTTTRYTRRIMQLVPSDLAFDFFEARGRRDVPSEDGNMMGFEIKDASSVNGRLFPPLTSKRQLTTCFLNAPYANGKVTICFVYTVGLDENPDNKAKNLGVLAKYLRKQLLLLNPPGYECQEDNGCWMLAFDRMAHAVTFGLSLKSTLEGAHELVGSVDRDSMFKVGILSGPFTSMGPHKTTGMADYFGAIVNRAARVASNCENGQVCVGIPLTNGVTADPPDFGPTVNVSLQGIKKLKGITIDVAMFLCSKRRIESLY